ncbi:GIY-YIG nuclease family protein [Aliarcobacter butzleri]|uniref:GIY-YIG nuclease family protein n=1 Tax=Aliarcobacter butzleri TaxID=28197 RepID=UPI0021B23105|nr:GIY-YIG nuclease family protein [Aliarcobacter butzleri]MCT7538212.1 GIY-YIG nuclease family protein [Aliarcobacter butzleri]MCT7624909.1 GIY-YIG nuclease family protein [Aliarcobacter butzleri]
MPSNTDIVNQEIDELYVNMKYFVKMFLKPETWTEINPGLEWVENTFPLVVRSSIPRHCGVYAFIIKPNVFDLKITSMLYVGKATNLYERVGAYLTERGKSMTETRRPNICRMINTWDGYLNYYYTLTSTVAEAEELEDKIIETFIPIFNRDYPAETSTMMRMF